MRRQLIVRYGRLAGPSWQSCERLERERDWFQGLDVAEDTASLSE